MLCIFKIVSVLTFLKIVTLKVFINCKNFANLNSASLDYYNNTYYYYTYNNIVFDNNTNFISVNILWSNSYTLPDLARNEICALY